MANFAVPRETSEFEEVVVMVEGVKTTSGVEMCIVPDDGTRPTTWAAAATRPGKIGINIVGMDKGAYRVYVRVTDGGSLSVRDAGIFIIQ